MSSFSRPASSSARRNDCASSITRAQLGRHRPVGQPDPDDAHPSLHGPEASPRTVSDRNPRPSNRRRGGPRPRAPCDRELSWVTLELPSSTPQLAGRDRRAALARNVLLEHPAVLTFRLGHRVHRVDLLAGPASALPGTKSHAAAIAASWSEVARSIVGRRHNPRTSDRIAGDCKELLGPGRLCGHVDSGPLRSTVGPLEQRPRHVASAQFSPRVGYTIETVFGGRAGGGDSVHVPPLSSVVQSRSPNRNTQVLASITISEVGSANSVPTAGPSLLVHVLPAS